MKVYLIFFIAVFLNSGAYATQCTVSWTLKASGFTLGISKEVLNLKEDGALDLTAEFNPNIALRVFGVDKVKRVILLDEKHNIINRQEVIGTGEESKSSLWKNVDKNSYQQIIKSEVVGTVVLNENERAIDSTIFPYLFYLNMFNNSKMKVKVFGNDPAYDAVISWEKLEKIKLTFVGGKKKGYVILNEDKFPEYFSFNQDEKTVEGFQSNWQCK